jgi:hypothetical protein
LVVISMTPACAREPYSEAAAAPFTTSMLSMSLGSMSEMLPREMIAVHDHQRLLAARDALGPAELDRGRVARLGARLMILAPAMRPWIMPPALARRTRRFWLDLDLVHRERELGARRRRGHAGHHHALERDRAALEQEVAPAPPARPAPCTFCVAVCARSARANLARPRRHVHDQEAALRVREGAELEAGR